MFMGFYGFFILIMVVITLLIFSSIHNITYTVHNESEQLNVYRNVLLIETFQNFINGYNSLYRVEHTLSNMGLVREEGRIDGITITEYNKSFVLSTTDKPYVYGVG